MALALHNAKSYRECLAICSENNRCNYVTFTEDRYTIERRTCTLFETCEFQEDSYNIFSGHRSCPAPFRCDLKGQCVGKYIKHFNEYEIDNCFDECLDLEACTYVVFNDKANECMLLEDCRRLMDIEDSISSEQYCSGPGSGSATYQAVSGNVMVSIQTQNFTRQVSAMITSARPTASPVVWTFLSAFVLFC